MSIDNLSPEEIRNGVLRQIAQLEKDALNDKSMTDSEFERRSADIIASHGEVIRQALSASLETSETSSDVLQSARKLVAHIDQCTISNPMTDTNVLWYTRLLREAIVSYDTRPSPPPTDELAEAKLDIKTLLAICRDQENEVDTVDNDFPAGARRAIARRWFPVETGESHGG